MTGGDNCNDNASCTNNLGSFECNCKNGYAGVSSVNGESSGDEESDGDGTVCENVDECGSEELNNCNANAVCTDSNGSFTCNCNDGFIGNGIDCTDVDECTIDTDNCHTNATCTNNPGSFDCGCNSGYAGDGTICKGFVFQIERNNKYVFRH